MDYSTVTDLQTLKAAAYDQIALKEQAEATLRTINQRIVAVSVKAALPNGGATSDPAAASDETAGSDSEQQDEQAADS